MKQIAIINGPNLNLIGRREPEIYGQQCMEDYVATLKKRFPTADIHYYQSNIEGELVNYIQQAGTTCDAIIINAGGYSHTSVAIHDALKAVALPTIEVHISNIFARESYRHQTLLTSVCRGMIVGLGLQGYELALQALMESN